MVETCVYSNTAHSLRPCIEFRFFSSTATDCERSKLKLEIQVELIDSSFQQSPHKLLQHFVPEFSSFLKKILCFTFKKVISLLGVSLLVYSQHIKDLKWFIKIQTM